MKTYLPYIEIRPKTLLAVFLWGFGCISATFGQTQRFAKFQGKHEAHSSWGCSNSSTYSTVTIVTGDCKFFTYSCWSYESGGFGYHHDDTRAVVTVGMELGLRGYCPDEGQLHCSGKVAVPETDTTINLPRLHCEWGAGDCKWTNHNVKANFYDAYTLTSITDMDNNITGYICVKSNTDDVIKVTFPAVTSYSASVYYYMVITDAGNNVLGRASCGNTPGVKTFSLTDFYLSRPIWNEKVYLSTVSTMSGGGPDYNELAITNKTAAGEITFVKPFPDPTISKTEPHCYGESNGSITLTFPVTDISKYTLTISTLRIGNDCDSTNSSSFLGYCLEGSVANVTSTNSSITLSNLSAGAYEVKAEANNGTPSCIKTFFIELPNPHELILNNAFAKNNYTWGDSIYQIQRYGAKDTITVNLSGGHPPYRYSINNGTAYSDTIRNALYNYADVAAGSYTVKVTDAHNCNAQGNKTIPVSMKQPGVIAIEGLAVDTVSCHSGNNGKHNDGNIQFNIKGGIGPYNISLNTVANIVNPQNDNDVLLEGVSAIGYKVFVKDKYVSGWDSTINVPSHTLLGFNTITAADKHWPNCIGGSDGYLKVSGYGGKPLATMNYTFGIIAGNDTTWADADSITDLNALQPYNIVIKDALGCRDTLNNIVIPQNPNPLKIVLVDTIPPVCNSYNNGKASFTGINGLPYANGYDFSLTNVDNQDNEEKTAYSPQFDGLKKGTYEITIKDKHDCVINDYYRDTVFISEPDQIVIKDSVRQVSRKGINNGYIQTAFSGGNKKYRYEWYNGLSALSDSIIKTGTTSDTAFIDKVGVGDYLLRVADTCGCNNGQGPNAWLEWETHISEPEQALSFQVKEYKNVSCNGLNDGRLIVEGTGGWGNNYRYGVQVDALSYDSEFNHLPAGLYTIYVVDEQNEVFSDTVRITEPVKLAASLVFSEPAKCYGNSDGSFGLSFSGGTQPYFVSVDNNQHKIQGAGIAGLEAGVYDVLVSDSNQCWDTVQVTILQPDSLTTTLNNLVHTRCGEASGEISVACIGGTAGYSYLWYDNNNVLKGTSSYITTLPAGVYRLNLTDANSCHKLSDWYTITNSDGPIATDTVITPVSCFGYLDGKAQISVEKGMPPYTYKWSNGQLTESATGLQSGIYFVTVTDHDNCANTVSVEIPSPAQLTVATSAINNPQCYNYSNGSVTVSGQGGTAPYQYIWDNGYSGESLSGVKAGSYTATVTDFNGCASITSVQLDNPEPVVVDLGGQITICGGQTVTLDAGSFATFNWNSDNGYTNQSQIVSLKEQGNYYLEVTDAHGCGGTDTFKIITSNSLLKSDFLIKSEAYTGDTVVAIDISWPLPDSTYWLYDTKAINHFSAKDYENLIFTKPGTYQITMYATLGECRDNYSHEITIKANDDTKNTKSGEEEPLIQKFIVRPNPNSGNFTTEIELNEESDIILKLYGNSLLIDVKKIKGMSSYLVEFNLPGLLPGVYVLYLTAGNEQKQLKMIIY